MKIFNKITILILLFSLETAIIACSFNQKPAENPDTTPYSMSILDDVGFKNYDVDAGLISDTELSLIENPISDNNDYRFIFFNNEGCKQIKTCVPDNLNVIDSAIVWGNGQRTCVFLCANFSREEPGYSLLVFNETSENPIKSIQLSDCGITDTNDVLQISACPAGYVIVYSTDTIWIIDTEHPTSTISKRIDKIFNVWCCDNSIVVSSFNNDSSDSIYCLDYQLKELYCYHFSFNNIGREYKVIASDDKKIIVCGEKGIFSFAHKNKEYSTLILYEQYAISELICAGISSNGDLLLCANFDVSDDSDMGGFKWLRMTPAAESEKRLDFDVYVLYDNGFTNESIFKIFGAIYGYNTRVTYMFSDDDINALKYNGQADLFNAKKAELLKNKADLYYIPAGNIINSSSFSYKATVPLYTCDCCVYDSKLVNSADIFTYRKLDLISFDNLSGTYFPFAYHDDKEAIKDILYLSKNPEELTSEYKYVNSINVEEYIYYDCFGYKFCGLPGKYKDSVHKEHLGAYYSSASADNNKKLSDFEEFLYSNEFSELFNTNSCGIYTESQEANISIIDYNLELIDNGFINNNLFRVGIIGNNMDSLKQKLLVLLENSENYQFSDSIISALFYEELHAYVNGAEDSDKAAEVFSQRVNRYLSENDSN